MNITAIQSQALRRPDVYHVQENVQANAVARVAYVAVGIIVSVGSVLLAGPVGLVVPILFIAVAICKNAGPVYRFFVPSGEVHHHYHSPPVSRRVVRPEPSVSVFPDPVYRCPVGYRQETTYNQLAFGGNARQRPQGHRIPPTQGEERRSIGGAMLANMRQTFRGGIRQSPQGHNIPFQQGEIRRSVGGQSRKVSRAHQHNHRASSRGGRRKIGGII